MKKGHPVRPGDERILDAAEQLFAQRDERVERRARQRR